MWICSLDICTHLMRTHRLLDIGCLYLCKYVYTNTCTHICACVCRRMILFQPLLVTWSCRCISLRRQAPGSVSVAPSVDHEFQESLGCAARGPLSPSTPSKPAPPQCLTDNFLAGVWLRSSAYALCIQPVQGSGGLWDASTQTASKGGWKQVRKPQPPAASSVSACTMKLHCRPTS